MATATPTRKTARPANGQTPVEYLQEALDDLVKARDRAGDDIRSGIDSAIDRTRDALREAGSEAQEQVGDWRRSLEKATDDLRRDLGIVAVRAQSSPEALKAMSAEIRKRKAEIAPPS